MKDTFKKNSKAFLDRQSRRNKKIHPWLQKFTPLSLRKHFQKLDARATTIRELKKQLASQIENSQTVQAEQQIRLSQLADQVQEYKERLSTAGKVGTIGAPKQTAVAGPYFCDIGSLQRLKKDLSDFFSEKLGADRLPNDQQWEMILSENPSTCVNAGAGSGKSTTLVLRLYVMRRFLQIPWEHISVFTFTKNSRWDLVDKLVTTFKKLDAPITQLIAENVIRTFHSYAYLLEARSTGIRQLKIFDLIGKKSESPKSTMTELQCEDGNFSADEIYDVESSLVDFQNAPLKHDDDEQPDEKQELQEALKTIYNTAFGGSEEFREFIHELYLRSMTLSGSTEENYAPTLWFLKKHDEESTKYTDALMGDLKEYADVFDLDVPPQQMGAGKSSLYVRFNARIAATNQLILFGGDNIPRDALFPETTVNISSFLKAKRKYLLNCSDILPLIINTRAQLDELARYLRYYSPDKINEAPAFDYQPDGEFTKDGERGHIATRFFSLIQFVENFGLDFQSWSTHVNLDTLSKGDQFFVAAVRLYHSYYRDYLKNNGYVSFNELFLKIQPNKLDLVSESDLTIRARMMHVLIDEFQDITPLYSGYVKAIKQSLALKSKQAGSLLVVGDDFQSIYGWKGSTVDLILGFSEHFITYEKPLLIKMENNHRCTQPIIRFAESIIEKIPPSNRTEKKGIAVPESNDVPIPRIFSVPHKNFIRQIVDFIRDEAEIIQPTPEHPLLVLSRSNATITDLKASFRNDNRIKMMTFHASKGLEGQSVILVGDCKYDGRNWIKNDVLRQHVDQTAHGDNKYDRMQQLETLRLAYVATTRAAKRCHWILKDSDESKYSALRKLLQKNILVQPKLFDFVECSETTRLLPKD